MYFMKMTDITTSVPIKHNYLYFQPKLARKLIDKPVAIMFPSGQSQIFTQRKTSKARNLKPDLITKRTAPQNIANINRSKTNMAGDMALSYT